MEVVSAARGDRSHVDGKSERNKGMARTLSWVSDWLVVA